jgi:hypothetical protein
VKLTAHRRQEAIQRLAEGAAQADLARSDGVSQANHQPAGCAQPFRGKRGRRVRKCQAARP